MRYFRAMAGKRKLKVYRTPIGFHDAYVAAPSQKAALEAWGADVDLFARDIAEVVTDPELTKAPLAAPGTVVRRLRDYPAELDTKPPASKPDGSRPRAKQSAAPKPRPDRSKLDEAEQTIAEVDARHDRKRDALAEREAELRRECQSIEWRHDEERVKLGKARDRAKASYERALDRWRSSRPR